VGGAVGSGGNPATGGSQASGGTTTTGGSGKGGATGAGGKSAGTGGTAKGGATGTGGTIAATGGATGTGGKSAGTGGTSKGGATGAGGTSGAPSKITVWLAGDSTMANGSNPCPVGWGAKFQAYFSSNATVVNSAVGGTTVRSWLYNVTSTIGADGDCTLSSTAPQAHWTAMVNGMKAGDYLLIQFGINDTTSATCPKHVSIAMYEQLFGMMAQAAKDAGANPIFLTAVSSISCNGAVAQPTRGTFAAATKAAATQYNVPLIDLEQLSVALYTASGLCPNTDTAASYTANTPVGNFFCNDHTHFEAAGATQIAGVVAKALKDQGIGLASYLLP
jgi:lysophospholipase L1-like esterase